MASSGLAIASLVMGILGFILMWIPILGFLLALLALIFGIIALTQINRTPAIRGKAMAIIGIILGVIALIFNILVVAGIIAFISSGNVGLFLNSTA